MADIDRQRFPKLDQAESLLVDFLVEHPNMVELADSLDAFFRWMSKYGKKAEESNQ